MNRPVVAMVCHFPPPVHGAALISERIREHFVQQGHTILSVDTAPHSLSRSLKYYLIRLRGLARLRLLLGLSRDDIIYCSVNSNWGVLIDLIVALIARAVGVELWLHHHSFFYLERSRLLHSATFAANRRRTHHIVLCEIMRNGIIERYGLENDKVHILSNINFLKPADPGSATAAHKPVSIGFLSNITAEKGISDFLKLAGRLKGSSLNFEIAGPIVDASYGWIRDLELSSNGHIRWIGALDEEEKARFLDRNDILVFPTRYRNEAEPLVIYEAMAAGAVVVAYDRGCIREMIEPPHFLAASFDELERAVQNLLVDRPARAKICEKYAKRRDAYRKHLAVLERL